MELPQPSSSGHKMPGVGKPPERVRGLSYDDFIHQYVIPRKPVILEGAIDHWAALKKWTPDFWRENYGDRRVEIDNKSYTLRQVIDLAVDPKGDRPPYYRNIRLGREFPELVPDISPLPPVCLPNWFYSAIFKPLKAGLLGYGEHELFIGGAGQSFPYVHFDVPGTHTFFHQLHGEKTLVLFPPEDTPYLYPLDGTSFNISRIKDIDNVPLDEFPLFVNSTRIDVRLGPGDTFFMPCCWWHTAKMMSFSVSILVDVANETNWDNVVKFVGRKAKAKLGPMSGLFMAYIKLAGKLLERTDRLPLSK